MKIQDRVTTYDQSKKLKELGVNNILTPHDFAFFHKEPCFVRWVEEDRISVSLLGENMTEKSTVHANELIKAFDGAQIDAMLPDTLPNNEAFELNVGHTGNEKGYSTTYFDDDAKALFDIDLVANGKTRLEAKTNLLIQLLKQGFIKLEQ